MSGAGANVPMPQAEPNGLFMPPTAEASWAVIMTKRGPKPYYSETRLEGSPERIRGADESQTIWPDGNPIPPEVDAHRHHPGHLYRAAAAQQRGLKPLGAQPRHRRAGVGVPARGIVRGDHAVALRAR